MDNIFIRYCNMPCTIHSYVKLNADDTYTIIINERLCYEMQEEAKEHEIKHIVNGDYEKKPDVGMIEIIAHAI